MTQLPEVPIGTLLEESEEKYRVVVSTVQDAVVMIDGHGTVTLWNEAARRLFGYSPEEALGKDVHQLLSLPKDQAGYREGLAHFHGTGEGPAVRKVLELTALRKDGSELLVEMAVSPVRVGGKMCSVGVARDITQRQLTERVMMASELRWRAIFTMSPYPIAIARQSDGTLLAVNPAFEEFSGMVSEEVLGRSVVDIGLIWDSQMAQIDETLNRDGRVNRLEIVTYHRQQVIRNTLYSAVFIPWDVEPCVVSIFIDVTEQRRAEEALRESEIWFRRIAERSFDVIYLTDTEGNVTYVSPASESVFGYLPEEVVGRNMKEFVAEKDVPLAFERLARLVDGEDSIVSELELKRKNGKLARVEAKSAPVYEDSRIVGVQGIIRDVTEQREAEETLRHMEGKLAHVSRLSTLGEMVAGIAHELSQPLYSIQNIAKACRNVLARQPAGGELDDLQEWYDEMADCAARAGAIVRQLRDFARPAELTHEPTSVSSLLEDSIKMMAAEARRRRVGIRLARGCDSCRVTVDRIQIQQVLINLLQNACEAMDEERFTRREIIIRTRQVDSFAEISVTDNGPGLPTKPGLQIFEPFVTTKPSGLGIGLAICATIVHRHGGDLQARTNPEGGATFSFTLPRILEESSDAR